MDIRQQKEEAISLVLFDYFQILQDDGLLHENCMSAADISYLAKKCLDTIEEEDVKQFEKDHEAALEEGSRNQEVQD